MTASAKLPSLFGRFTAVLKDHEHLGATLRGLRSMCAGLEAREAAANSSEPSRLLEDLRRELSQHFAAEEAESYFGTIADESPSLAPGIAQLKREHALMLDALDALCLISNDAAREMDLCRSTRELIAELERHERAESLLLRDLFAPAR